MPEIRRAKIVATLGPSSRSIGMVDALVEAGMDAVRLNFSHGAHEEHAETIKNVRLISGQRMIPIAIIADLQGPKIRTGPMANGGPIQLKAGQLFTLSAGAKIKGGSEGCGTNYLRLPKEVRKDDRILLSDGLIELRVLSAKGADVRCEVVNGGELGSFKGINLPGVRTKIPALTPKDRTDLEFALKAGVNYIAVSFVRSAADVKITKAAIAKAGFDTPVIAKIEKPEAVDNLEEILKVADGVMVARGDLGVEMNPERVPTVQKRIISRAREHARPVITATQMLESMTQNPRPTRAEASDVANAVLDGTGALMLSGETASGKYPVETVAMMDRIIREAEASMRETHQPHFSVRPSVAETLCDTVFHAAEALDIKAIACFTESGGTARLLSKFRPKPRIIAFSSYQETRRRLSLFWGVLARKIDRIEDIDGLAHAAEQRLLEENLVKKGDIVAIVAGTPLGTSGTTNLLKLHTIGGEPAPKTPAQKP